MYSEEFIKCIYTYLLDDEAILEKKKMTNKTQPKNKMCMLKKIPALSMYLSTEPNVSTK